MALDFALHSREGEGKSEFQHFIKKSKIFPEMPSGISAWPE